MINYSFLLTATISLLFLFACQPKITAPMQKTYLTEVPPETTPLVSARSTGVKKKLEKFGKLTYKSMVKTEAKVPDVNIHSTDGEAFNLYSELEKGKPILLITASHTCYVAREKIPDMQKLTQAYKEQLGMYIVYVLEAHPADTASPYSPTGDIWVGKPNIEDSIKVKNPTTYGERKALANFWQDEYEIEANVLIDTPQNAFWENFGQAPNMAYLLRPDGTVYYKQAWFNGEELDLKIQEMLKNL